MNKLIACLLTVLFLGAVAEAQKCDYWRSRVDFRFADTTADIDEKDPRNILIGIDCLLREQGNRRPSFLIRSEANVSDILPRPTVELSALYYISYLFYGGHDFAGATALLDDPPKFAGPVQNLRYDSTSTIRRAYRSYRHWFRRVKRLGLEKARQLKLDPLAGSSVQWK